MSKELLSLSPEQLSLALLLVAQSENQEEVEVPSELQNLSEQDWGYLEYLLSFLMYEKSQMSLH